MTAIYRRHKELTIQLDGNDSSTLGQGTFEYVLNKLCADYECELIGRTYRIKDYIAQDFLSRVTWKQYTLEFKDWKKLLYRKKIRLFPQHIPLDIMEAMGYPTDRESLKKMGLMQRGGYVVGGDTTVLR